MASDTKTEILNSAEQMTKLKGFDAFSYRDISQVVGVKTSTIHYYFPTKGDLAFALIERYTDNFSNLLKDICAKETDAYKRIKALFATLENAFGECKNLCLCGMLSANVQSLSEQSKLKLDQFFSFYENWLEQTLKEGISAGSIHSSLRPRSTASELVATTQGAMLIARTRSNNDYLRELTQIILARLRP